MEPITREETYLAAAAGQKVVPPKPVTRQEMFLQAILDKLSEGSGGGGSTGGGEKILYMDAALLNAGGAYPVDADDYTTAVIPAEATFVSLEAFNNMPKLDTLIVNGNCEFELLEEIVDKYVYYYNAITKNYIPIRKLTAKDRTEIPAYFMDGVGPMVEIEISGSVGEAAFDECRYLKKATLENCSAIGRAAFFGCYALTKITLPDGLTSIGVNAFGHCYSLTEVTIPDSVTSIGQNAFQYCTSLTEVTIPASVASIETTAFNNCTNLATVTILGMETTITAYSIPTTTTIRAYAGSAAETFANENGYTFEVIE